MNLLRVILERCVEIKMIFFTQRIKIARVKLFLSVHDCHPKTAIAPWLIDRDGSGIINSSENSILYPSPKHSGHAPNGLLKEKLRGSISSILISQTGHEKLWLKFRDSPSITSTTSRPSASSSTFSTESVSRFQFRFYYKTIYNNLNIMLDILI